ncbi:MAG: nitrilase-related carbon-nitrogen hydrolase [Fimbriimonadaceae bacterium]
MPFTVACAQIAPRKGELEANLDKIAALISQASSEGADLVIFPEAATTGYFLEGGVLELAQTAGALAAAVASRIPHPPAPSPFAGTNHPENGEGGPDVLIGFYERAEGNLYNSAAYLSFASGKAEVVHVYRKFFLPTYGVFDEERFVSHGRGLGLTDTRLGKTGILICEDVWHSVLPTLLAVKGAQIILVPSASPARGFQGETPGNLDRYRRMLTAISEEHAVFCVNCQLTGFEGGKGFVGGSSVIDPFGKLIAQSPVQEEHLLLAEIDLGLIEIARARAPLISDLQGAWQDILKLGQG